MARVKSRIPCYFWVSASTGKRLSWNFPSRKAANRWRDDECKQYSRYGSLEIFLEDYPKTSHERQAVYWRKARERWLDMKLKRGIFETSPPRLWKYEEE